MEALRLEGYFCYKAHGSEYTMAGLPDIIVCAEGLFVGLEVKLPHTRDDVSAIQTRVHEAIRTAGGKVEVVTGVEEALRVVENLVVESSRAG